MPTWKNGPLKMKKYGNLPFSKTSWSSSPGNLPNVVRHCHFPHQNHVELPPHPAFQLHFISGPPLQILLQ